jgi:hypothetical protein
MIEFRFQQLQGEPLRGTSRRLFLPIRRLADRYRSQNAAADQIVFSNVMRLIGSEPDVSQWDTQSTAAFIRIAQDVLERDLSVQAGNGPLHDTVFSDIQDKADWLCSLVMAANGNIPIETALQACNFWVRSRLINGLDQINPDALTASVLDTFDAAGLSREQLGALVKLEFVLQAAHRVETASLSPEKVEQAKLWCSELLRDPALRERLYNSAITLDVDIPKIEVPDELPEKPPVQPQGAGSEKNVTERLWVLPSLPAPSDLTHQFDDLIFELLSHASLLSKETADRIDTLARSAGTRAAAQFFFASRDLWHTFVRRGIREALPLMERVALYTYANYVHRNEPEYRRRNVLRLWVNAQLPQKLLAWPIEDLLKEMAALYRAARFSAQPTDIEFKEAIIEAFAGEAKAREVEDDPAGRKELVEENRDSLNSLYKEYIARSDRRRPNEETLNAWDYLYPPTKPTDQPSSGPVARIVDDHDFQTIINRGGHEETHEFACAHVDEISDLLIRRLDVSFGQDSLMMPTGRIFNTKGAAAGQLDNRFVEARSLLQEDNRDYQTAARLFERLEGRLEGRPKQIATDFFAYALAKAGISLQARLKLSELSPGYTFSSGYWNRVCCLPAEQRAQQIELLEQGLEKAPHPQLLNGLVVLSLQIQDQMRLKTWLPCLTFTEALLIFYQLVYDELDDASRERQILRLGANVVEGELALLNPFDPYLKSLDIERMFDRLLRRDQRQAIEFWLHCRRLISYNRFDYWELKANYHERTGGIADAAKAFREELRCRLSALEDAVRRQARNVAGQAQYLKRRVDKWLQQCRTPDLKSTGVSIYNAVVTFANDNERALRALDIRLAPPEQHRRYFGEEEEFGDPEDFPPREDSGVTPGGQERPGSGGMFDVLLVRVVGEAQSRLHQVSDLPLVREQLEELNRAFDRRGARASAQALRQVLQSWAKYAREGADAGRMEAYREAQEAVRECEKQFRLELRDQALNFAQLLVPVLNRVTTRLLRDSPMLPKLSVETLDGRPTTVDSEAAQSAFAALIRNQSDSATVRITKALASVEGGTTEFSCRDQLDDVKVLIQPKGTEILTFATPPNFVIPGTTKVTIVLRYEFGGGEFDPGPFSINLINEPAPELPRGSPYIHGRMIEASEIEGHFFGRENEQKEILDTVRDGQRRFRYVEGIRHSGKSSLLQSIEYEIAKQAIPLIPIYHSIASAGSVNSAGGILANILAKAASHPELTKLGVVAPDEQRCNENMPSAYLSFTTQLSEKLPDQRVLMMVDDMQALAEAGQAARDSNPPLFHGIMGLLNLIRENGRPSAPLVWVLAGQVAKSLFPRMMPGVLLWAELRSLPIDFLTVSAVEEIVREPLRSSQIVVPPETIARIHQHTAGHPEVVQQIAELMLFSAVSEKRFLLTPADADSAAQELANTSDDLFAETWYPAHVLTKEQKELVADFVSSVHPGGKIELYKLAKDREVTEALKAAVQDLVTKKIMDSHEDGTISVKAYVLDLWLRRSIAKLVGTHQFGSPAIFLDIANLTAGRGTPYVADLRTAEGEGFPGRFTLATVLERIEQYVRTLTPAPVAIRWAVNYPPGSPAVTEVSKKEYLIKNIPEDFRMKGADDIVLMDKISEVENSYPTANHIVLILGDKDYRLNLDRLIRSGKFVHVISREEAMAKTYQAYAARYPDHVTAISLEELLATRGSPPR